MSMHGYFRTTKTRRENVFFLMWDRPRTVAARLFPDNANKTRVFAANTVFGVVGTGFGQFLLVAMQRCMTGHGRSWSTKIGSIMTDHGRSWTPKSVAHLLFFAPRQKNRSWAEVSKVGNRGEQAR